MLSKSCHGIFWLTAWLKDECNSVAKATTWFWTVWCYFAFYMQCQCFPLCAIHLWQQKVSIWWWHMMASLCNRNCLYFYSGYFELFKQLLICTGGWTWENEVLWILCFSDDNWGTRCHLLRYVWAPVIIITYNKQAH